MLRISRGAAARKLIGDCIGRAKRQGYERQSAVGAAGSGQSGGADNEQVFVIMGAAKRIAHTAGGVEAHAATASRMIEVTNLCTSTTGGAVLTVSSC